MNNNNYPYYAIEIHGWNDNIFCIKHVVGDGFINPVNRIAYKSLEEAQTAADQLGYKIEKIGSSYQII